jgi:hypothetical protein
VDLEAGNTVERSAVKFCFFCGGKVGAVVDGWMRKTKPPIVPGLVGSDRRFVVAAYPSKPHSLVIAA